MDRTLFIQAHLSHFPTLKQFMLYIFNIKNGNNITNIMMYIINPLTPNIKNVINKLINDDIAAITINMLDCFVRLSISF
jgi:hypothetical protein